MAQAMLGDLIANNLITAKHAADITAMGNTTLPWWQSVGYPHPITGQDLVDAGLQKPVDWKEPVVEPTPDIPAEQ
jgi:hypothetical protein